MAFIYLKDGWRDESTEGPYTDILQTKYVDGINYTIVKSIYDNAIKVKINSRELVGTFKNLDTAKQAVDNIISNKRTKNEWNEISNN